MMKVIKRIIAAALIGTMVFVLAACGSTNRQVEAETDAAGGRIVRVGFVYPKTGDLATFGEYSEAWTNYAISKANEAGITIDGAKAELSLITADSMSDPQQARKAAKELIDEKNIDIMITSKTADTTVPVSEICESKGVVCLSVDTPDEAWAVKDHTYSFHAGFDTETELETFFEVWDKTDNNKRVGVLHPNDTEGSIMINAMPDFAEEKGYTVYDPGTYQPGQQNFKNVIRNLKTQKVEILAGVMTTADFANFYQQLKEDGYLENIKAITIARAAVFNTDIEALGVSGMYSEIWWIPQFPTKSSIDGMTSEQLGEQFTNVTGEDAVPSTAGYDYANIEILYAVLNAAGTLDTSKLIEAAKALDLETVIGNVKYNDRHYSVQPLAAGQWEVGTNGQWQQNIIAPGTVDGLEANAELKPLG